MGTRKRNTQVTPAPIAAGPAARLPEPVGRSRAFMPTPAARVAQPEHVSVAAPAPGLSSAVAQLPVRFATVHNAHSAHADLLHMAPPPSARVERAAPRRTGVRQHFGELRSALADGWEIVQPIFARPLWNVTDDSTTAFNFVLRRERTTRLLTVPEGRTVERFIRERHLAVDYRR